jgi:hypothetical protein
MSALASDGIIPDDEDISYEMLVSKKRYEASFYQKSSTSDSARTARELQEYFLTKYTKDQLDNPSAELVDAMLEDGLSFMADKHSKKSVWFMISERYGKYYINLFYDNEYNRANGDDL